MYIRCVVHTGTFMSVAEIKSAKIITDSYRTKVSFSLPKTAACRPPSLPKRSTTHQYKHNTTTSRRCAGVPYRMGAGRFLIERRSHLTINIVRIMGGGAGGDSCFVVDVARAHGLLLFYVHPTSPQQKLFHD